MCSGPAWKREIVPDHKFDFIDTREFTDNGCGMRMKYLWLYIIVLKDFLVYCIDIFTAITMLTTSSWSNQIFNSCPKSEDNGCVAVPFQIGKWLFVGCIIFSFLLLAYEAQKAKKIIASRDISYAFTNIMANNYYSLRSYDHFCFFAHISDSTKTADDFAFFVFFTFKSWKRVLLADGPRQSINALTLYSFYLVKEDKGPWYEVSKYFEGNSVITSALTVSTLSTVIIFVGSLLLLIVAGICYIPLLCHIQGNLKEYCCYKVDKRISEIIARRNKQRQVKAAELAKKEAAGDYSHLKNKKGELVAKPLPQPTLPNLSVDDDLDDSSSMRTRGTAPSTYTTQSDYYSEHKGGYLADYPPMPAYNQPYSHHQAPGGYPNYNASVPTIHDDNQLYEDETGSTAHLAPGAAPFNHGHEAQSSVSDYGYMADPHDAYYGGQHQPPMNYDAEVQSHSPLQVNDPYDPDRPASRTPAPQYEAYPQQPQVDPYAENLYGGGRDDPYSQYHHDPYAQYQRDPYGQQQQYHQGGGPGGDSTGYAGQAI